MKYFTRDKWERGGPVWNAALAKYSEYYKTLSKKLSHALSEFEELEGRHTFHDEILIRHHRLSKDRFTLELQSWWIDFFEVEQYSFEDELNDHTNVWLIHEIDVAGPSRFRMMVLFEAGELDITAGLIQVYSRRLRKIVVPSSSHPEDRQTKLKRNR